ncbi:MAG: DNA adenine methylase [Proteobacteria bacterium]|nr:DNA adenine methylase [Pseudomonadota bacterium]
MATAVHELTSARRNRNRIPRPFLKWVGGKSQILVELNKSFPSGFKHYYEPFLGGGAVFFDLLHEPATISDSNEELINCYKVVRTRVEKLIIALNRHVYDKEHYYEVRGWDPMKLNSVQRAARTIYLNRAGFNGLYRVNSKGGFNVPFGRHKNPTICDEDNLRGCSKTLANIKIKCVSFEKVLDWARPNDLVYFDPPYIPVSDTAYFTAYQKRGFGMDSQENLAKVFDDLASRGVYAVLSNSDVPWIHERYSNHHIRLIKANRFVNSDASRRGPVGEVIVTSCS